MQYVEMYGNQAMAKRPTMVRHRRILLSGLFIPRLALSL
jgi:hypothetical protein